MTIRRAGTYRITVMIDGVIVPDSLLFEPEVQPAAFDATKSVPKDLPYTMYAGYNY